ncbi:MAG: hypothetical protein ACTSWN_17035 [Promethearchaeota archaeon]
MFRSSVQDGNKLKNETRSSSKIEPSGPVPITRKERNRALKISIVGIYSATCVAAAYSLMLLPNIEIYTMLVFLGGLLFGRAMGSLIGLVSTLIYRLFNIYGPSPLPLLLMQLSLYTFIGFLGGALGKSSFRKNVTGKTQVIFAFIGGSFALVYSVTADVTYAMIFNIPIVAQLLYGLAFTSILIISNIITFGLLLPLIMKPLDKFLPAILGDVDGGNGDGGDRSSASAG